jgi:glycosyltransferase involved in cell wall biosynthesis
LAVAEPLLTVVTVTFNALHAFQKTLASVQSQSVRARFEYLVVDGASTDGTVGEVRAAAARGEVDAWGSEPDRGIYDAMNKAVSRASGHFVLFLNAGDVFPASNTLERFLDIGEARPAFLWGDSEVDRNGTILADPAGRMLRFLYRQMTVCHQSLAVRRDLLASHPFDLSLRVVADYAVLCALVSAGEPGLYRPVVVSRVEDEGFSSKHFFLGLEEKRRVSHRFFPGDRWRSEPYFALWGLYMKLKIWYKERP